MAMKMIAQTIKSKIWSIIYIISIVLIFYFSALIVFNIFDIYINKPVSNIYGTIDLNNNSGEQIVIMMDGTVYLKQETNMTQIDAGITRKKYGR